MSLPAILLPWISSPGFLPLPASPSSVSSYPAFDSGRQKGDNHHEEKYMYFYRCHRRLPPLDDPSPPDIPLGTGTSGRQDHHYRLCRIHDPGRSIFHPRLHSLENQESRHDDLYCHQQHLCSRRRSRPWHDRRLTVMLLFFLSVPVLGRSTLIDLPEGFCKIAHFPKTTLIRNI